MKSIKFTAAALVVAIAFAAVAVVANPAPTKAAMTNNNLGSLIVLNGLYGGSTAGLAGLVAVDNATGGGLGGGVAGGSNLGSLIVLNGLFNGGGFKSGSNMAGLAGLIAVSNITGNGY